MTERLVALRLFSFSMAYLSFFRRLALVTSARKRALYAFGV